jgi:hypothetical protein
MTPTFARYDVADGGGIFDLEHGLFWGKGDEQAYIKFSVRGLLHAFIFVRINGVAREDASGKRFFIFGYAYYPERDTNGAWTIPQKAEHGKVEIYFDIDRRKGWMEYIDRFPY